MNIQKVLDEYLAHVYHEEHMELRTHGDGYSYWTSRNTSSATWEPTAQELLDNGELIPRKDGITLKVGPADPIFVPYYVDWAKVRRRIEDHLRKNLDAVYAIAVRLNIQL